MTQVQSKPWGLAPALAERWEQLDTSKWRFFLRDGVKFHNGAPFTADQAAWAVNFVGSKTSGAGSYGTHGDLTAQVVDRLTIDITCGVACPLLPRMVTFNMAEKDYTQTSPDAKTKPVGAGPYRLLEWRAGQFIRLEVYPDYWGSKPAFPRVDLVWRSEPLVRAAMVAAGEADFAYDIGFEQLGSVPKAAVGGANEAVAFQFNSTWHPYLKDVRLRQALAMAVDCPALVRAFLAGKGRCSPSGWTEATLGNLPEFQQLRPFDPVRARQTIKEVGAEGIELVIHTRKARFYRDVELAEAVAGFWRDVGIKARVSVDESGVWSTFLETGALKANSDPNAPLPGAPDVIIQNPSDSLLDIPSFVRRQISCKSSRSRFCDPVTIEPLLTKALAATGEERVRLSQELGKWWYENVPTLMIYELTVVYGLNKDLEYEPRPDGLVDISSDLRWSR
ncbi:MAG: hypothetical protein HY680_01560 [Chloroflexi bacterium]|nr:hypothetical protein [Chloroflexota bacterium]